MGMAVEGELELKPTLKEDGMTMEGVLELTRCSVKLEQPQVVI